MTGGSKVPAFKANYGILDVEQGRKALLKHINRKEPVPVIIHAIITDAYGGDDGTSIEFNMRVVKVEVGDANSA